MTAVLDATPEVADDALPAAAPLGSWPSRVGAFAVDVLLGVAVVATMAVLANATSVRSWSWWVFVAVAALTVMLIAVNRYLLPAVMGWSLGRGLFGIAVKRPSPGGDAGLGRLMARDVAHLLDTAALFIGWLWPLWDRRRRTFADLLLRTEVFAVQRPRRDMRRLTAVVFGAAALLCVAGVGLSYLAVYRPAQAVEQARAQIAEQGPGIVEQMLSYGVDTMPDDFVRAQNLATGGYRDQLVAQQLAAQRGGATTNEYWAASSAVLPLPESADRASMLLALQGQRDTDVNSLKFITATVRVDFEKSDGQWRVANLIVLKAPAMGGTGQ